MARNGQGAISLSLSVRQRLAVDEMKAQLGFMNDSDFLRVAIANQARVSGIDLPRDLFRLQTATRK